MKGGKKTAKTENPVSLILSTFVNQRQAEKAT
jgi:hypothetical protein